MNRKRPSRHYRKIKTKQGRKRILINKNIRKSKFQNKGIIETDERKIFTFISNPNNYDKEYGGAIDFDLQGNIEQINISPGHELEVDLPVDYEVQYHTHPDKNPNPPTSDDVIALLHNNRQQAEIVFQKGRAFVIVKTPLTRALSKLPATQLKHKLDKAFYSSMRKKNWEKSWADYLESQGFSVYTDQNLNKPLPVKIHPVEPARKRKRKKVYDPWRSFT